MNKKETIKRKNERNMKYEIRSRGFNMEALRRECCNNCLANHQMRLPDTIYYDDNILPMNNKESHTLIWGSLL